MKFDTWLSLYKKIYKSDYFNEHISPLLTNLIKNYSDKHAFVKIKDKYVNKALSDITTMSRIIITLDAEFQTVINNVLPYTEINIKRDNVSPLIRELGMMIFIMDKKERIWYYIGSMHINFQLYRDIDKLRFILSKYCTVTAKTRRLMEENDKIFDVSQILSLDKDKIYKIINKSILVDQFSDNKDRVLDILREEGELTEKDKISIRRLLRNIPFEVYGEYIKDTKYEKVFKDQLMIYMNDPLVNKRLLSKEEEVNLINIFHKLTPYTCLVLKGKRDLAGLRNTASYIGYENDINFTDIYDIEIFNPLSRNKYGNAQLETTYLGMIKSKLYKKHIKPVFKHIQKDVGKDAHNPVVDSLFTIIVAITINIALNKCLH